MKKMILGLALFTCGFFGAIALVCATVLSPLNPWSYNGVEGFYGAILGMQLQLPCILCLVTAALGLALCIVEAVRAK